MISNKELKILESGAPLMLIFDITNVCNLKCVHCPHNDLVARSDYVPTHLSFDHVKKVIEEIKDEKMQFIRITGDGEPLTHPKLNKIVKYIKKTTKIPINLTTNGTLLKRNRSETLLESGIDVIDISIDALYKKTYERLRQYNYEKLMKNIFDLLTLREKMGAKTKIMVNAINRAEIESEIGTFKRYWEQLVDFVAIRNMHSAGSEINYDSLKKERSNIDRYPCPHLWKRLTIDYDGNVKFCAHDWQDRSIIGNIADESLLQMWQGEKLNMIRNHHLNNDFGYIDICHKCIDWSSVTWDKGYEKIMSKLA